MLAREMRLCSLTPEADGTFQLVLEGKDGKRVVLRGARSVVVEAKQEESLREVTYGAEPGRQPGAEVTIFLTGERFEDEP